MRYSVVAAGRRRAPVPGRLAQRESASFTPRRSLVRSQYRPPQVRGRSRRAGGLLRSSCSNGCSSSGWPVQALAKAWVIIAGRLEERAGLMDRPGSEPTKIPAKSAAAFGLRVLRAALRATRDCDLRRFKSAPGGRMARPGAGMKLAATKAIHPGQVTGIHTGEPPGGNRYFPQTRGEGNCYYLPECPKARRTGGPVPTCPTCNGRCRCPRCDGSGKVGGIVTNVCPLCRGSKVCPTCNGTGRR